MDLIMTTSRRKGLEHHISPGNFNILKRIITISGASLDTLTSEATRIINTHPTPHKIHTYFIAGIPDITSKINNVGYEEVLFIDNAETAHHNFMTKIKNTKEIISLTKSIPCFAIRIHHTDKRRIQYAHAKTRNMNTTQTELIQRCTQDTLWGISRRATSKWRNKNTLGRGHTTINHDQ